MNTSQTLFTGLEVRNVQDEESLSTPSTETRPLFCIATLESIPTFPFSEIQFHYRHAATRHEARIFHITAHVDIFGRARRPFRIIAISEVVGYKVLDNHGERLLA
jgi:hypothetical protein